MAGLLDLLMGRGEYLDPNKVLDQRMATAGIPNPPRNVPVQAQPAPGAAAPAGYSMADIMASINAKRQAQQQQQAMQALQVQGGQVLPQRY